MNVLSGTALYFGKVETSPHDHMRCEDGRDTGQADRCDSNSVGCEMSAMSLWLDREASIS